MADDVSSIGPALSVATSEYHTGCLSVALKSLTHTFWLLTGWAMVASKVAFFIFPYDPVSTYALAPVTSAQSLLAFVPDPRGTKYSFASELVVVLPATWLIRVIQADGHVSADVVPSTAPLLIILQMTILSRMMTLRTRKRMRVGKYGNADRIFFEVIPHFSVVEPVSHGQMV